MREEHGFGSDMHNNLLYGGRHVCFGALTDGLLRKTAYYGKKLLIFLGSIFLLSIVYLQACAGRSAYIVLRRTGGTDGAGRTGMGKRQTGT